MSFGQFPDKAVGFPVGLMLATGQITGFSSINKFGRVYGASAGVNVLWEGGGTYNWANEAGVVLYHSSSDMADAGKVITHHLLEASTWNEVVINATCLGTVIGTIWSSGTIEGTYVRNWRKYNIGLGTRFNDHMIGTHYTYFGSYSGTVALEPGTNGTPNDPSSILSYILPGTYNNQTQMAVWTVPGDEQFVCMGFYYSALRSTGVTAVGLDVDLVAARVGQPFRSILPEGVINTGAAPYNHVFQVPQVLNAKTDIALLFDPSATAYVTGGFYGWRIKV